MALKKSCKNSRFEKFFKKSKIVALDDPWRSDFEKSTFAALDDPKKIILNFP